MIAASWPRDDVRTTRLLSIDVAREEVRDGTIGDLRGLVRADDLLVVNDAATVPASLHGRTRAGAPVEVRLAGENGDGTFRAVLFGPGDWRTRTEERPSPPRLAAGDEIRFDGLRASIDRVDGSSPRLLSLRFAEQGDAFWRALYRAGRPVQYAHARASLALWHVQTAWAARPWAAEAPSAGFPVTWDLLLEVQRRGAAVFWVTHAAGLSSTGDAALDARLPFPERYDLPAETISAIGRTARRRGRVIAIGTTVVRALEGADRNGGGTLQPGEGVTDLRIGPGTRRHVVDAIVTGIHEPGTSHFALLQSFAPAALLARANAIAEERGYVAHEFGDAMVIFAPHP